MEQKFLSLYDEHSHRDQRTLVLDRLRRDHRCIGACIEVLEHRLQVQRIFKGAASFTEKLIDQLLDAPDEFHHHLERSAYHRLRARIGRLVPDALDLVKHQDEIRERRCDIMRFRDASPFGYMDSADTRAVLRNFCALRRSKIELEEEHLFPLFIKGLHSSDWACLQEEAEAYDAIVATLTPKNSRCNGVYELHC
ncbi:MAG: hypothetical protein GXP04_07095 [Alphaproteobacteria bacterium]|nr:hypothetical protein [Alphaproteobacteria bacterium]